MGQQLGLALRACRHRRGTTESPLAAFYFGSFRNNYVDDRPEKRYRELESFPGFEIDEIAARRFAKLTGEVNLPPVRFAEVGTAAFYLSYIRPAVFAGAMATEEPQGGSRTIRQRRRAARPRLHRRDAAADGLFDRRGGGLPGRRLSQDRVAGFAQNHVGCGQESGRNHRLVARPGAGADADGGVHLARRVQAGQLSGNGRTSACSGAWRRSSPIR